MAGRKACFSCEGPFLTLTEKALAGFWNASSNDPFFVKSESFHRHTGKRHTVMLPERNTKIL